MTKIIAMTDLVKCIRENCHNLVPGSLSVAIGEDYVEFEVQELSLFEVTAGIIDNKIVDTTEDSKAYYATLEEYATFLQGEESPVTDTEEDFDTDTYKYKIRQTFGVKAIDWRGLFRNSA